MISYSRRLIIKDRRKENHRKEGERYVNESVGFLGTGVVVFWQQVSRKGSRSNIRFHGLLLGAADFVPVWSDASADHSGGCGVQQGCRSFCYDVSSSFSVSADERSYRKFFLYDHRNQLTVAAV